MQTTNIKLDFKTIVGLIFFLSLFVAIFTKSYIFDFLIGQSGTAEIEASQKAAKDTADLLLSLDKINLDTTILSSTYLQSLQVLPSFPLDARTLSNFGKANPFLGNFTVVSNPATTSVGSVIYSSQRSANDGRSLRPVNPTTGQ